MAQSSSFPNSVWERRPRNGVSRLQSETGRETEFRQSGLPNRVWQPEGVDPLIRAGYLHCRHMETLMKTRVQKWGNSLALRIPKSFAAEAGLREDTSVELSVV